VIVKIERAPLERGGYVLRFDDGLGHFKARALTLGEAYHALGHYYEPRRHRAMEDCPICRDRLMDAASRARIAGQTHGGGRPPRLREK